MSAEEPLANPPAHRAVSDAFDKLLGGYKDGSEVRGVIHGVYHGYQYGQTGNPRELQRSQEQYATAPNLVKGLQNLSELEKWGGGY